MKFDVLFSKMSRSKTSSPFVQNPDPDISSNKQKEKKCEIVAMAVFC